MNTLNKTILLLFIFSLIFAIGCTKKVEDISQKNAEDIVQNFMNGFFSENDSDYKIINSYKEDSYWKIYIILLFEKEDAMGNLLFEIDKKTGKVEYITFLTDTKEIKLTLEEFLNLSYGDSGATLLK